jgi:hypothetical protein
MDEQARSDGLQLLRAARDIHVEQHGGDEDSFQARTTLDLVAAGERIRLPTGYDRHNDAVEWLESEDAIEPDPMYRRVVGGPIYQVTQRGVEMLDET